MAGRQGTENSKEYRQVPKSSLEGSGLAPFDVAILGGAFDPPHVGHLIMGAAALVLGFARDVWFVPSPDRPDKSMVRPFDERRKLVDLSLRQVTSELQQHLMTSSCEQELGDFRGSLFLMTTLVQRFPNKRFGFVMGGDVLSRIMTWNDPMTGRMTGAAFLNHVPCLVFGRGSSGGQGDGGVAVPSVPGSLVVADIDCVAAANDLFRRAGLPQPGGSFSYSQLSSTRIREELASNCPDRDFMRLALGQLVLDRLCVPGKTTV